jgi:hypothetical protein
MDEKFQTSQQKAGEISDPGGKDSGVGPGPNLYGDENAPTGVSTKEAMSFENQLKTTQQIRGEFSCPEGSSK